MNKDHRIKITTSASEKKVNKAGAFNAIDFLINNLADTDCYHTKGALSDLYSYFLPKIKTLTKKQQGNDFLWANLAKSDDQTRIALNNVIADDGVLVGCDGKRLHFVDTPMRDGYYDTAMNIIDIEHHYPNWKQVVPDYENKYYKQYVTEEIHKEITSHVVNDDKHGLYYKFELNDMSFSIVKKYYDQAISGTIGGYDFYHAPKKGGEHPVVIAYHHGSDNSMERTAVIMGLRID